MNTFLINWNPNAWYWAKIEEEIALVEKKTGDIRPWRFANKKVQPGDRIYLIRLGKEPKGIFGSGYARSTRYYDDEGTACIDVEFDTLFNSDLQKPLSLSKLQTKAPEQNWTPQASGISIKPTAVVQLEALWDKFLAKEFPVNSTSPIPVNPVNSADVYYEGTTREQVVRKYERNAEARKQAINIHGTRCFSCEIQFDEKYGKLGEGFTHIHHLEPLSTIQEKYQLNVHTDLVPVCPNCHAMLHRQDPPLSIEQLRVIIKENS